MEINNDDKPNKRKTLKTFSTKSIELYSVEEDESADIVSSSSGSDEDDDDNSDEKDFNVDTFLQHFSTVDKAHAPPSRQNTRKGLSKTSLPRLTKAYSTPD